MSARVWKRSHTFSAGTVLIGMAVFIFTTAFIGSTSPRANFEDLSIVQTISTSDNSYLLTKDGSVYSVGLNNYGQLGDGTTENRSSFGLVEFPKDESNKPSIVKISSYGTYVLALDSSGSIWTWGNSQDGSLGRPASSVQTIPQKVVVSSEFQKFSTGSDFALALDSNGNLYSWGNNSSGQLGNGNTTAVGLPTSILTGKTFQSISAGSDFAFAIDSSGTLWGWGSNDSGQLGNGNKNSVSKPIQLGSQKWKTVYASQFSKTVLAIDENDNLYSWGSNANGLLGNGVDWRAQQVAENQRVAAQKAQILAADDARKQSLIDAKTSETIASLHAVWQTSRDAWLSANPEPLAGNYTPTSAFQTAHDAWVALNADWLKINPEPISKDQLTAGQLQDIQNSIESTFSYTDTSGIVAAVITEPPLGPESLSPILIASGVKFSSASIGRASALALDTQGGLWSWGSDSGGQTGLSFDASSHTQVPVKVGSGKYSAIYAGDGWSIAAGKDSGLYSWGINDESNRLQSTSSTLTSPTVFRSETFTSVSGATSTGSAIQSDGTSYTWGNNSSGLAGQKVDKSVVPFGSIEGQFFNISFSGDSALALSSNGALFLWGSTQVLSNSSATSTVNSPQLQDILQFKDIAAGRFSGFALDSSGSVWSWGLSWNGSRSNKLETLVQPTRLNLPEKITQIAAGQTDVLFATEDNSVYWQGNNSEGFNLTQASTSGSDKLGKIVKIVGSNTNFLLLDDQGEVWQTTLLTKASDGKQNSELQKIQLEEPATDISANGGVFSAVTNGNLYGWGDNSSRLISSDQVEEIFEPVKMASSPTGSWSQVAISETHILATTSTGVLYAWGKSNYIADLSASNDGLPVLVTVQKNGN